MNSTLIQQKFGSYGVEVLAQHPSQRITSLYSLDNQQRVTRSLAVARFHLNYPESVMRVHQTIIDGASIGQSFVDAGFGVVKHTATLMELPIHGELFALYDMMNLTTPSPLAYHAYELKVKSEDTWVSYADVIEVHSPSHLGIADFNAESTVDTVQPDALIHEFLTIVQEQVAPIRIAGNS
ncbi:MAG: hypothetical protein AAF465_16970 [Pseudomonadota bacterium]